MRQQYIERKFKSESLALIQTINQVCDDYADQGFVLTVRQLYYQLVARNIIPNNERSYKNTTSLVNDARLAGLVDWDAIEDRTRAFITQAHWTNGKAFMQSVAPQFFTDMWSDQDNRVFVIVEKEALTGVLEDVCEEYDVPLLAARGYPSVSVLREFAITRLLRNARRGQNMHILHLGDHDPSGIDMSRDLVDRLNLLCMGEYTFDLERIALNMDQIEENECPPNPAKLTDSRSDSYVQRFGTDSWELDALEPRYIVNLVRDKIGQLIDFDAWEKTDSFIDQTRRTLIKLADTFED